MTWTSPKDPNFMPGEILYAAEWNAYVGASGNTAYLYNEYSANNSVNYYNLANTIVANNTVTAMNVVNSPLTSFFVVPSSLYETSGQYYVYVNIEGNPEAAGSSRRRIEVLRGPSTGGWSTLWTHDTFSADTGSVKNVSMSFFPTLTQNDKLLVRFLHQTGSTTSFLTHVICRRLSK